MSRLVFATAAYGYLQDRLCAEPGFAKGALERRVYPDGERGLRITSDVRGKDCVLVGGTPTDAATLELFDLACGLVNLGAATLSMVVPYFGYSTQERAVKRGDVVTAKARAVLLSAVPRARVTSEILLLDLHTAGIAFYFEGHLQSVHLSAHALHLARVKAFAKESPGGAVVACTDAGRAKWVQSLANAAGVTAAFVYKARQENGQTVVTGVNADVSGKHVLIYDDMVRTGGSLVEAARAYRDAGAVRVTALTSHAVLPGESLANIRKAGVISELYATDSLPQAVELAALFPDFLKIEPLASLLAEHFKTT